MPSAHGLDAARIQLGLHGHAPAAAGRADEAFAAARDRRIHGQAKVTGWQVTLPTTAIALDPGEFAAAFKVGEGDRLGDVRHGLPP